MEHIVDQIIKESGLSKSSLAERSGLARSTQYRIRDGLVDPTVGSLRELALAGGFDLDVQLAPLSDPVAGQAARAILDPRFQQTRTKEIDAWVRRLQRWVPDGNPVEIVRWAGRSSNLLNRRHAVFLHGPVNDLKLASAGSFSKQPWLLSGAAVIDRVGERYEDGAAGQHVVYTADTHRFGRLLDHMKTVRPEKANLILADYTADLEEDSWVDGTIRLVAPIQGLIDAFGIGGELAVEADRIAKGW